MTLRQLLKLRKPSDALRIRASGIDIYVGYMASAKYHVRDLDRILDKEVISGEAVPEITHRNWRKLQLSNPLQLDQLPQYRFKDLQMTIYYTYDI